MNRIKFNAAVSAGNISFVQFNRISYTRPVLYVD